MENNTTFFEPLLKKAEEYGKISYELFKLKTVDKTVGIASTFVSRTIAVLFFSMVILIANIGVSLWLGELLGKLYYGFFFVAGFYLIIGIILYFFMRNWIKKRVSNSIISQILN